MKKSEVLAWYANSDRKVLKSHLSDTPYKARMYRRHGVAEDPWITYGHHDHCKGLYVENNLFPNCWGGFFSKAPGAKHQGLNVFIRRTADWESRSGWIFAGGDVDGFETSSLQGAKHHCADNGSCKGFTMSAATFRGMYGTRISSLWAEATPGHPTKRSRCPLPPSQQALVRFMEW